MIEEYKDILHEITELLRNKAPRRLSISAISRETGINRAAMVKYLEMLQIIGEVTMSKYGRSKLYTVSHTTTPYNDWLDIYSEAVVVLDSSCRIEMANKKFYKMFNLLLDADIKSRNINNLNLEIFNEEYVRNNIRRMINGLYYEKEIQYQDEGTKNVFNIRFVPPVSKQGKANFIIVISDMRFSDNKGGLLNDRTVFQKILDKLRLGIMFVGTEENILNAKKAIFEADAALPDMPGQCDHQYYSNLELIRIFFDTNNMNQLLNNLIIDTNKFYNSYDFGTNEADTNRNDSMYLEATFIPIRTKTGGNSSREYSVMINDITAEWNSMQGNEREMINYMSHFINTYNSIMIFRFDANKRKLILVDINRSAEVLFGIKKENAIGKPNTELFPFDTIVKNKESDIMMHNGIPQTANYIIHTFTPPTGEHYLLMINNIDERITQLFV